MSVYILPPQQNQMSSSSGPVLVAIIPASKGNFFSRKPNCHFILYKHFHKESFVILPHLFWGVSSPFCVEKTNSEVNISHETTTMVVWIYDGI